jgi:hypothetical protein
VFGKILLRPNPEPTLVRLREFDIQFALDIGETLQSFSQLSENDMAKFTPFANTYFLKHYAELYSALTEVTGKHLKWAQETKARHLKFCADIAGNGEAARERIRREGGRREKFANIGEALTGNLFFKDAVIECITNGGQRQTQIAERERLYNATMNNPFLGRMWKSILFCFVSWARLWEDQLLNFDPAPDRDDWVDMTLPLYACEGDVILTADKKLKSIIASVESAGSVTTALARDF